MSLFDNLLRIWKAPLPDGQKVVLAQKEIESNQNVLVDKMLNIRKKLDPALLQWFSNVETIDLGTANTNKMIWDRGGRGLFITEFDGAPANTAIRFNDKSSSKYPVRSGYIKGAFSRIYLTNTAQAGKTLKFIIGYRNFADFQMSGNIKDLYDQLVAINAVDFATQTTLTGLMLEVMKLIGTTPGLASVTMTSLDTEYSFTIPDGTSKLTLEIGGGGQPFRVAWAVGKVATPTLPYMIIAANEKYRLENVNLTEKIIYFACDVDSQIMVIETVT